jgi:hypothetical protein
MCDVRLRTTTTPVAVVVVCLTFAGCGGSADGWGVQGRLAKVFSGLPNGQSKEQVVEVLGQPARESEVFELPQPEGFESMFAQAKNSGASSFLYWDTGVDEVAVVGLNEHGRVVFKCRAGT